MCCQVHGTAVEIPVESLLTCSLDEQHYYMSRYRYHIIVSYRNSRTRWIPQHHNPDPPPSPQYMVHGAYAQGRSRAGPDSVDRPKRCFATARVCGPILTGTTTPAHQHAARVRRGATRARWMVAAARIHACAMRMVAMQTSIITLTKKPADAI